MIDQSEFEVRIGRRLPNGQARNGRHAENNPWENHNVYLLFVQYITTLDDNIYSKAATLRRREPGPEDPKTKAQRRNYQ